LTRRDPAPGHIEATKSRRRAVFAATQADRSNTNGIPSAASTINIAVPLPSVTRLASFTVRSGGSFQFAFTNSIGAQFSVLATTDLSLPLSRWMVLGGVLEIAPGQFMFTDPQAVNNPQRFYSIRSQ
jgi:hypothetical protein